METASQKDPAWVEVLLRLEGGDRAGAIQLLDVGSSTDDEGSSTDPVDNWIDSLLRAFVTSERRDLSAARPTDDELARATPRARNLGCALDSILLARTAISVGQPNEAALCAQSAVEDLASEWLWPRMVVASVFQAVFRFTGDVQFKEQAIGIATTVADRLDRPPMAILARGILGTIYLIAGELHATLESCNASIELARATGLEGHRLGALAHQFRGYVFFEWNRLPEARIELERAWTLAGDEGRGVRSGVARVLTAVDTALGDPASAGMWFERLEEIVAEPMSLRNREWLAAVRIRRGVQGDRDLREIDRWRRRYRYETDSLTALKDADVPARLQEYEHLLTVLEATSQWEALLALSEVTLRGSGTSRLWFAARALTAKAVALQGLHRAGEADLTWELALEAGRDEGYVRVYIDGTPIRYALLRRALDRPSARSQALRIYGALPDADKQGAGSVTLTSRQTEVLGWVAEGRSNREIGEILELSETTVRTHLRAIYARLNVRSRTQAAAEARKMGLLA